MNNQAPAGISIPDIIIPKTLEETLDPKWLSLALSEVSGGSPVVSAEVAEIDNRVASNVRVGVRFENDPDTVHRFCIKAALDMEEASRIGEVALYEANFYRFIAPHISVRVPGCPVVIIDEKTSTGFMIMEDIIAAGGRFNDAHDVFTIEQVKGTLDQLARLHSASHLLQSHTWITPGMDWMANPDFYRPDWMQKQMEDGRAGNLPMEGVTGVRLNKAMGALLEKGLAGPQTLLHGDTHTGNTLTLPDGPGFADWQLMKRGLWAMDIAYHINSVLAPDVAEREERHLLDYYLDALAQHGGTPPDRDAAWDDYRASVAYGFFLWVITVHVKPPIIHRIFQGLASAIIRHDTFDRLGVR